MERGLAKRLTAVATGALAALAALAPQAAAQGPEFVSLNQGTFTSPAVSWQGLAIRPNSIFLDLYDDEGILFHTYNAQFGEPPPKRGVSALGYRPLGLPTPSALLAGTAGTRVKRVKVLFGGAPSQKLTPVPAPAEWGFRARFFAAGATVDPAFAATTQVVRAVKAFDRKGRLLSKQTNVFTNPF